MGTRSRYTLLIRCLYCEQEWFLANWGILYLLSCPARGPDSTCIATGGTTIASLHMRLPADPTRPARTHFKPAPRGMR